MKKLLAILLALGLVLMSVAAMADVPAGAKDFIDADTADADEVTTTPSIKKTYTLTGGTLVPTETLEFEVKPEKETYPTITVGAAADNKLNVSGTTTEYTIPVNVPAAGEYPAAGRYHYTVAEKEPTAKSQGAGYDTTQYNVDVYVYYAPKAEGSTELVLTQYVAIYTGTEQTSGKIDTKNDEIENTYDVGGLKVTKTISGNLSDPTKVFTIVITLESENKVNSAITIEGNATASVTAIGWTENTITATLKGGESVTITGIPKDVTYTIEEKGDVTKLADNEATTQLNNANDATAYYVQGEVATAKPITENKTEEETITNTKGIEVPTGISVDFVPYVLIIALVGITLVAMKARKKEN